MMTTITPKAMEIKKRIRFKIFVKTTNTKQIIAKTAKINETIVAFFIPICIAKVLTPSPLSPSISSHPLIISRAMRRKEDVRKKR